jgi:uncharacterized protein YecT (DUF1311 family)
MPKITKIMVGDSVALRINPAKNTPMAGPSCAPDCMKAAKRPRYSRRLLPKLGTERKNALIEAQRAWIKFRDANCGFYGDPEGGSAARMAANECFLNATADRAKELQLLTNDK